MRLTLSIILFLNSLVIFSQEQITSGVYIERFKKIAIDEMKRSGIPASITLAQGMVESANGNSTLAKKSNNHFGIKCHKWNGKKVYHDDDDDDECFRKYESPEDSYRDHTDFLMNTNRYQFLFELRSDDYKKWAKGLKKAGYATNPRYADDLIKTIEQYNLHRFDNGDYRQTVIKKTKRQNDNTDESIEIDIKRRKTLERNRIKYIVAEKGDNISSITKELGMLSWEIRKYNEIETDSDISAGEVVYLQPKRWRAEVGNDFHIVKNGETMHYISQLYGIKLRKLYRKNRMELGTEPEEGQKIWLRKRKPSK